MCVFGVHIFFHYPYKTSIHDDTVYMAYIFIRVLWRTILAFFKKKWTQYVILVLWKCDEMSHVWKHISYHMVQFSKGIILHCSCNQSSQNLSQPKHGVDPRKEWWLASNFRYSGCQCTIPLHWLCNLPSFLYVSSILAISTKLYGNIRTAQRPQMLLYKCLKSVVGCIPAVVGSVFLWCLLSYVIPCVHCHSFFSHFDQLVVSAPAIVFISCMSMIMVSYTFVVSPFLSIFL